MTKKQLSRLKSLNIKPEKYFGDFRYYNYKRRGKSARYLFAYRKKSNQ